MRQKKRNKRLEHNLRWIKKNWDIRRQTTTSLGKERNILTVNSFKSFSVAWYFTLKIRYLEKKKKKKVELAGDTRLARQVAKLTCTLRFKMFTTGKKSKKVKMFAKIKERKVPEVSLWTSAACKRKQCKWTIKLNLSGELLSLKT